MEEFLASLSVEARKELFDYLHECRHKCRSSRRTELFANLTKLLALLEKAAPNESRGLRFMQLVESAGELNQTVLASSRFPDKPKRPTERKKTPSSD